jgi:hypothetical protein
MNHVNDTDITVNDKLIDEEAARQAKNNPPISGLITGKGDGNWGRITYRKDGSILIENASLSNIAIRNCDLVAESGEYPIPFADRANILDDWAMGSPLYPHEKLWAGNTHTFKGLTLEEAASESPCDLCERKKR